MDARTRSGPAPSTAPLTVSTMHEYPLTMASVLEYGRVVHGTTTVRTYYGDSPEDTTFAQVGGRAAALAHALTDVVGVETGQRVATFMPNITEHLESLFAVTSMGAVLQPLNSNLVADQLVHIINHAGDQVIICSPRSSRRLVPVMPDCPDVHTLVVTGTGGDAARKELSDLLADAGRGSIRVLGYEELLDGYPTSYDWPNVDETSPAALLYSTGTTGAPKGVAYSHRSMWLHAMNLRTPDSFGIRNGHSFLCAVPIFHVLSWGVPIAAFMAGTPLVFPGGAGGPAHLAHVIADAMPRMAHGAPSVWMQLVVHYQHTPPEKMSLQEIISGGAPVPPALIDAWEERYGVDMIHSWGMTETGPVGTVARTPVGVGGEARRRYRDSQGRFPIGMEFRVVGEDGTPQQANDRSSGEIQVRGNWVTTDYHHSPASAEGGAAHVFRGSDVDDNDDAAGRFTDDGWLRTGDIGTITRDGYLTVHDRQTDTIRSGGEWIYSAILENIVMESVVVAEAAVIGVPDERWGQRPLAVVVTTPGVERGRGTAEELAAAVATKVPRWMAPEYWTFVDRIDKTSVGKFDKKDLRAHLTDGEFDVIKLRGPGEPKPAGEEQ
ncbi:MAG: long-chain fatty-acid--CoA ligase [Corynebacterium sp.]|uniref:long-chain fatty-acid--CoA ligase n=1 Tax=unclassified Corynebacterium TaxID=2624378 RepID=UPI002647FFE4|nr:long-chain fatty-acid--CoA ligase [Corynebacterium sp.]MDN5581160.1 long-chain fatty-acid--CoA ligase [Corynebacterium sp.]MDN5718713.1 long-chain fatty-acid--CoA ligase [Corynebacterium sp.]MDN6324132.1 long-chain fatty-acid--CoA ligase [Corynebacterium sp.]